MKRILLMAAVIVGALLSAPVYAHGPFPRLSKEEFRKRQKEFIIKSADITPAEAEKLFPLYFELQDKKEEYNRQVWQNIRKGNNPNTTDTEYSKITEDIIKTRITIDQLELEYLGKYKKFLSPKKIYNLQRSEMRFHREMIKEHKGGKDKKTR